MDSDFSAHITSLEDHEKTCSATTWNAMMVFVKSLKKRGTKIAFFSSTPQGGGVALMRHALVVGALGILSSLSYCLREGSDSVSTLNRLVLLYLS